MGNRGSQSFSDKQFFLLDKNLLKINLMNFFIGIIDTQLLKTIFLKNLKPINIQKFDFLPFIEMTQVLSLINFIVQFFNDP